MAVSRILFLRGCPRIRRSFLSRCSRSTPRLRGMRLLPGSCPPEADRPGAGSLLCLAPHGVFRAPALARRAVGSYPAFSPLPRTPCGEPGGIFSVTLSVAPDFRPTRPRILRGMLPGGVRTFLCRGRSRTAIISHPFAASRTRGEVASIRCWMLDVRCWMFFVDDVSTRSLPRKTPHQP